ncbi:sodium:proton exchanger [Mesorhizobium comanense]|uniref:sodium:proton exchanger n=1 Tax=Mesorhizobium comanense TaxID=2502215 RepID=UPI0010F769CF|nr:sodium:proton exchanger [Mesorhizobium comanense]
MELAFKDHSNDPARSYTARQVSMIALVGATLIPLVFVRFFGVGGGSAVVIATVMGVGIVAASFALSWGVEALEGVMPQGVALAILALIEVAPEYTFEAILAYRQQIELAAASMTGANRLLLGLGWPLILFTAALASRARGQRYTAIELSREQGVPVFFLLVASVYAFVIVIKGTLSLIDSGVLIAIYGAYIWVMLRRRQPELEEEREETEQALGIAATTKGMPPARKWTAIGAFFAFGAFVLYAGAEPFLDAVLEVAHGLGISQFALIQWLAPFLSEFPESLTAYIWAATVVAAAMGLGTLISSKLNQWTLLIATIPIAYSLGAGHIQALPLGTVARDEIFLTAAQSLFGTVLLLTLRFDLWKAFALLGLFLIQFFLPFDRVHVTLAWAYLALTLTYLIIYRRHFWALLLASRSAIAMDR